MTLQLHSPEPWPARPALAEHAFTLPEVIVTMAVSMLVMAGLITTYIFGLKLFEFCKPKLCASDNARMAFDKLSAEIRSAQLIRVGQGNLTSFTEVSLGSLQQGNAIQVYGSTDTNSFSRYYWDSTDQTVKRITNGGSYTENIAHCVTNQLVFTSEDYSGNILTNNLNNRVIGLTLQFYQIEYPVVQIGAGQFYDYYQVHAKLTRRNLF